MRPAADFIYHKILATPQQIEPIMAEITKPNATWHGAEPWAERSAGGYGAANACNFLQILPETELNRLVHPVMIEGVGQYQSTITNVPLNRHELYKALRYDVGQGQEAHFDGGDPVTYRLLSGVFYLNDDYEGGELDFPELKVRYKPKAGELFLFPSNFCFVHSAMPVTKGRKYAVASWFLY